MGTSGAQSNLIATLHSTPEQAGEEFSRIRPKLAVYSHYSLFGTPEPTMDELVARTRKTYQGRLEIGEDLTAISVGDSVVVSRWSDETRNQLRAIERARLRSLVDADVATARRLHADDFELINPLGGTLSKEKYLRDIESGDLDYLEWEPGEIRVRLYDKSAVIRYKANLIVSVKGSAGRPVTFWHTDLYEKRNGEWQIVWSHATQVQQR
jgi:hypothetical protein